MFLVVGGAVYALFAVACFRLAAIHDYETGVSVGEGMFTLAGAAALFAAVPQHRGRAMIVLLGTLPLVVWFAATPWSSSWIGRPVGFEAGYTQLGGLLISKVIMAGSLCF